VRERTTCAGGPSISATGWPSSRASRTIRPTGIGTLTQPSRGSELTVNWFGSGQILNNGVTLTLNAQRELTIIAGGDTTAGTHIVIDVTGYYR